MAEIEGFWSYVHLDDEAEGGRISQLARDVKSQYEMITGDKLSLFLDKDAISWGEEWHSKIDNSIGSVAFFIPVITPRYFMSPECRRELHFFARRAKNLGIEDLILPLIYLDSPYLHSTDKDDDLIELIKTFQWEDWTENRFADIGSRSYRKGVAKLASRLVDANRQTEIKDIALKTETEITSDEETDDSPGLIDRLAKMEVTFPLWVKTLEDLEKEIRS
ncbi:toll/interleukin-1 receptor domain-containing protein, partial [bacterium]|nr:toll/interleukin-1 receptor domain-containing protein [bacterium]